MATPPRKQEFTPDVTYGVNLLPITCGWTSEHREGSQLLAGAAVEVFR